MTNEQKKVERIRIYIPQSYKKLENDKNQRPEYKTLCIPVDKNLPLFYERTNMGGSYTHLRRGVVTQDSESNRNSVPVWAEKICVLTLHNEDNEEFQTEYHTLCSLEEALEVFHSRNDNVNGYSDGTFKFLLDSENQSLYELMMEEHISKDAPNSEYKLELLNLDSRIKAKAITTTERAIKREKNAKIKQEKERKLREEKDCLLKEQQQEEDRLEKIKNASPEELALYGLNAEGEPYFS